MSQDQKSRNKSGRGLPQSRTLPRPPSANSVAIASRIAPALWRFRPAFSRTTGNHKLIMPSRITPARNCAANRRGRSWRTAIKRTVPTPNPSDESRCLQCSAAVSAASVGGVSPPDTHPGTGTVPELAGETPTLPVCAAKRRGRSWRTAIKRTVPTTNPRDEPSPPRSISYARKSGE